MRIKIFRWRAVGPLLVLFLIGVVIWLLFADEIARQTAQDVGTDVVGAKVEIRQLDLDMPGGDVTMRGLTVANPFEPMRNLFEADEVAVDIDPLPLLEKKVVIDRVAILGMRFGTERRTSGVVKGGGGRAADVMRQVQDWKERIDIPVLQLARGEMDMAVLDPAKLESVRAATALSAAAESSAAAWRAAARDLDLQPVIDSSRALAERLRNARPTDLALINDTRRAIERLRRTRDTVVALQRAMTRGLDSLRAGLRKLDHARERDYAMARGLLRLPSLSPPDVASALFAPVVIDRFQRALYWTEQARRYMPPGLLPRTDPGPRRARRSGTTVRFPREHDYPPFLLREAEITANLGPAGGEQRTLGGRLTGLTSAPAVYGRPTVFEGRAPRVQLGALVDHVRDVARDTAGAQLGGVALPSFALPGLPFQVDPGRGTLGLRVNVTGDGIQASFSVNADAVRWERRQTGEETELERIVGNVLRRITALDLSATLSGSVTNPNLSIRSNLDRAVSGALKAALGEEVAAAERRLRAEVDRLVQQHAGPVRERVAALEREVNERIAAEMAKLDGVQREMEQRLRELTRGIPLPL